MKQMRHDQRTPQIGGREPPPLVGSCTPGCHDEVKGAVEQEVRVEKWVPGGDAFCRLPDGRAVFIPGAVPQDKLRIRKAKGKRDFIRVEEYELLEASPLRRVAACPYATHCGGCDWMHVAESTQAQAKTSLLEEALKRTAGLHELPCKLEYVASQDALGYRSRIRLHHVPDRGIGFFSPSSHALVPIQNCAVAAPRVNRAVATLQQLFESDPACFTGVSEIEIRALAPRIELTLLANAGSSVASHQRLRLQNAFPAEEYLLYFGQEPSGKTAQESASLIQTIEHAGSTLEIAPGAFTQINWSVNQGIVNQALAFAAETAAKTFCDLYCGNGNFSLPLLLQGLSGVGVESNPRGIELAKRSAARHKLPGEFSAADVAEKVKHWSKQGRSWDLVVVDPPRSGAGEIAADIASLTKRALFICACDPVPFARDLKHYLNAGFELVALKVHDMFPQTHHFETVAELKRR